MQNSKIEILENCVVSLNGLWDILNNPTEINSLDVCLTIEGIKADIERVVKAINEDC